MSEVIGMMEGAFFVSRGELIQWINDTFQLNVSKIEQLGSGSVYCQILDVIYPGKVNMSKVNWKAHLEWEFITNLKLLQQAFSKCGLNKHIEVERLAKAKYQDNLEFAQWMKRFYDLNGGANKEYDPVARRGNAAPDFGFGDKQIPTRTKHEEKPVAVRQRSKEKLRSVDPSSRYESKYKAEPAPSKVKGIGVDRETTKDVKSLYQYLMTMKALVEGTNLENAEKIDKLSELIDSSLKLKVFDADRSSKKEQKEMIAKMQEDLSSDVL